MSVDEGVPKYFNMEFWEWQAGERRTQAEFAEYLGVGPSTLGHWINGIRKPDYESALLLSEKLGPEIFDICGYLRPDPEIRSLIAKWDNLTSGAKRDILQTAGVEVLDIGTVGSESN